MGGASGVLEGGVRIAAGIGTTEAPPVLGRAVSRRQEPSSEKAAMEPADSIEVRPVLVVLEL